MNSRSDRNRKQPPARDDAQGGARVASSTETTRTLAYFNLQVTEFRELMGSRDFWRDVDKQMLAIRALGHLFFQLKISPADHEKALDTFQGVIDEYARRLALVAMHPSCLERR